MGYVDVSDFCKDVMRNYDIKEDKAVPCLLYTSLLFVAGYGMYSYHISEFLV